MPPVLYPKERIILDFIMQFTDRYGYAPTLKEIGESSNMHSPATIHEHIEKLRVKGYVKKLDGASRGLEVIRSIYRNDQTAASPQLPVLGYIAAGSPLEPYTDPNYYMSVPPGMVSSTKAGYLLQVKGKSMVEDGIMDGDFVVVQHQEDVKSGDIVVAMLPNGLTALKRIFFEKDRIKLMPANSEMSPIFTTHVRIQGKVVGLIRKFPN